MKAINMIVNHLADAHPDVFADEDLRIVEARLRLGEPNWNRWFPEVMGRWSRWHWHRSTGNSEFAPKKGDSLCRDCTESFVRFVLENK